MQLVADVCPNRMSLAVRKCPNSTKEIIMDAGHHCVECRMISFKLDVVC